MTRQAPFTCALRQRLLMRARDWLHLRQIQRERRNSLIRGFRRFLCRLLCRVGGRKCILGGRFRLLGLGMRALRAWVWGLVSKWDLRLDVFGSEWWITGM